MLKLLRIALAELLLVCFFSWTLLSPVIYAEGLDEQIPTEANIELLLETPVSEVLAPDIASSGSTEPGSSFLDTVASGSLENGTQGELTQGDSTTTISTGSTENSPNTHSGNIMVVDATAIANNSGSTALDILESDELETTPDRELQLKEGSNPTEEILVQFHTDIDGYLGGYQVEQVAALNNLTTEELIAENNIAVMSVEEDIVTPFVSNSNSGSLISQFSDIAVEERIDEVISTIKQDPRVAHVQRNFVYTIASYNPQSIWTNASTGVTTSTGQVAYFQIIAPSTVTVNQAFDVTIRPKDANGLTVTNYTGSFIFISDYSGDIVPSSEQAIVFSGSNGEMTFPLGIRLGNLGQNNIRITDTGNQNITGLATVHVQSVLPVTVNDPDFSKLWGLHNDGQSVDGNIGTIDADIDYPEAIAYASGRLGTGLIVAVLDTGVAYNHPDLAQNMWDGSNCLSDTGASLGGCVHGYDFAYDDKIPTDFFGHGSHVAGTIGAITNNGTGTTGVSPNVEIMSVKVLDDGGYGTTADIIRGINFAKHNGANVINASLGKHYSVHDRGDFDFLTYEAIRAFPGIFVAAAGNSSINMNESYRAYPAGFGIDTTVSGEVIIDREVVVSGEEIIPGLPNVISVAASNQNDTLASFSNYGSRTVHIAAPGTNIYSTIPSYTWTESTSRITYNNGWTRQASSGSGSWNTRIIDTVSGELTISGEDTIDLSSVLWGDTRYPYVSGESSYIQKTFSNPDKNISKMSLSVWCDTPDAGFGDQFDRLDILMSTGGLFERQIDLNEFRLREFGTGFRRDIEVNGHLGAYARYDLWSDTLNEINQSTSFDLRLKWVSEGGSTSHYGCFVNNITVEYAQPRASYDYYDGTSMAAPHVAGAAALAMSYAPTASIQDIRRAILWTSDYKSQLGDKVMYGRLNVTNMLKGLENPTITSTKVTLSGESGAKIQLKLSVDNDRIWKSVFISKNKNFYGTSGILPQIETLYANGIISSRDEDTITYEVTRAEAAKFIATIGGYSPTTCTGIFTDVGSGLGDLCGYIESLAQNNIISTGSIFSPNRVITHGEFYKMLVRAAGEEPSLIGNSEFERYAQRIGEMGCGGISLKYDNAIIRYDLFHMSVCVFGLDDVTDTRWFSQGYNDETIDITGLSADTTYYYYTEVSSAISYTGSRFSYQSFRTPKFVPPSATGSIIGSGSSYYLSGSTASGVTYGTGGAQKLILSDTGSTAILELSLTGLTLIASGSWDGIFSGPRIIATNTGIRLASGSVISIENVYEIGSPESSLALSGKLATIRIKTSYSSGTILRVYRSDNSGFTFLDIGSCTVSGGECVFATNHFSQFSVGNPTNPPAPQNHVSTSGGGGPSSTTTTYSSLSSLSGNLLLQVINPLGQTTLSNVKKKSPKELHEMTIYINVALLSIDGTTKDTIITTLTESVQSGSYTKLGKLIMYDRMLTSINRMLKEYPSIQSEEYKVLIDVRKEIKNERLQFIKKEILKKGS